ncbi:RNA-binding domain-containing protein [Paenibacillus sp. FSL R5-0490]|uniref:RNA-binding domain-containing protein n=1 Tax=Paenibacillus sp. FSL R5-0490 TaxID=1920424 RepID=UPI0030D0D5DD
MFYIDDMFKEIIQKKETTNVKYYFTVQPADKMAEEMVAFANTDGGYIFWGINFKTEFELVGITGVWIEERLQEIVNQIPKELNYCMSNFNVEGTTIFGIRIFKSKDCLKFNGKKYIMNGNISEQVNSKIFISHASKDEKYGAALVGLLEDIGVKSKDIIFTSDDEHGVPLAANIPDYLKNQLDNNCFMIYLLSDNYFDSPACLNEMGAAWVKTNDYVSIGVPSFSFGNNKFNGAFIDTRKLGLNMDNRTKLVSFRKLIQEKFNIEKIDDERWSRKLEEYLKKIED